MCGSRSQQSAIALRVLQISRRAKPSDPTRDVRKVLRLGIVDRCHAGHIEPVLPVESVGLSKGRFRVTTVGGRPTSFTKLCNTRH